MTGFTSTGLLSLLHRVLEAADPGLTRGIDRADPMERAITSEAAKRNLIDRAMTAHGPGLLLRVGLHLDEADEAPVLTVLRRAPDPQVIAAKWMRLERYHHAAHRTVIDTAAPGLWRCRRHSETTPASLGENLLIAGVLFGLLTLAGLRPETLEIGGHLLHPDFRDADPGRTDGACFSIRWSGSSRDAALPRPQADRLSDRLTDLLAADPGRSWRIDDAAAPLALSRRSLQRKLAAEGRSFSTLLRRARMREAVRLLGQDRAGLADIGYCCGYADQAHFHRDFRRAANMTPKTFRAIAARDQIGAIVQ